MKRTIVVLFLVFLFSNLSNAQIYKGFGVKVGTSMTNQVVTTGLFGGFDYKYGFTAGILRETPLFEKLRLVTGVNYVQKGAKEGFITTDDYGKYTGTNYFTMHSNFLSLEVLAKYSGGADKVSPYVIAGGRMDVFVSGKTEWDVKSNIIGDMPYLVSTNKTFGATIGAGLDIKPSKLITLFVEGSYNPDLTNLGERENTWGPKYTIKNYTFELKTGIRF
jgi:opacity protein-like surface antigen